MVFLQVLYKIYLPFCKVYFCIIESKTVSFLFDHILRPFSYYLILDNISNFTKIKTVVCRYENLKITFLHKGALRKSCFFVIFMAKINLSLTFQNLATNFVSLEVFLFCCVVVLCCASFTNIYNPVLLSNCFF